MGIRIDGKAIAAAVRADVKSEVQALKEQGIFPGMAVVIVGDDPASRIYVNNKKKACAEVGIYSEEFALPASTTQEELIRLVHELNARKDIHGILVQSPLPVGLDEKAVVENIDPKKDVDAFHPESVGRLSLGQAGYLPCTPAGILTLLRAYGVNPSGKHCVVVGRSNIVGKPLALLLLQADATVTVCHSKTPDLADQCRRADILVSAAGQVGLITADMVRPHAVVIDVAMNRGADGRLCGDVDFGAVAQRADYITPVPGGVGPMTRAMLMENTYQAALGRASR